MRCLRLPFTFDPERLRADLSRVEPDEWIPHINRHDYEGRWSGAALRSIGGSSVNLVPDAPDLAAFRETALLARCPYFREVLATFRCPLQSVRLLRLHAGSSIAEHVDRALDFDDGEVRLHVPVVTSDAVEFHLDGSRLVMAPGECWYTNVNLPHGVDNHGTVDRIHLVIDCQVDAWLRDVFARTPPPRYEGHAARVHLPPATAREQIFDFLAGRAAAFSNPGHRVAFMAEASTLILAWPGRHTWQLRLHLGEATGAGCTLRVESSPDPEGNHQADHTRLLADFAAHFPGCQVDAAPV